MRIPDPGERVHPGLERVFAAALVCTVELAFIAPHEAVGYFFVVLAIELHPKYLVHQALAPQCIQGIGILGPRLVLAVDLQRIPG